MMPSLLCPLASHGGIAAMARVKSGSGDAEDDKIPLAEDGAPTLEQQLPSDVNANNRKNLYMQQEHQDEGTPKMEGSQ